MPLFALFLHAIGSPLVAEEKQANSSADQSLDVRTWRVPPEFFPPSKNDPNDASVKEKHARGAQSFFEANGLTFPEGSFARYDPRANKVVVRNTAENLDLAELVLFGPDCVFPNIAVDIVALDCRLPASTGVARAQWPTLEEIRKLPATEVRVLSQASTIVKSGLRVASRQQSFARVTENESKRAASAVQSPASEKFQPGEFGAKLEVEPVVGADGMTVELNYWYQLRQPDSDGAESELDLSGALLVQDNSSKIFHVSPLGTEGRTLILIAGIRFLDFEGIKTPLPWE